MTNKDYNKLIDNINNTFQAFQKSTCSIQTEYEDNPNSAATLEQINMLRSATLVTMRYLADIFEAHINEEHCDNTKATDVNYPERW